MFNPHTEFEVSTITRNEEMKGRNWILLAKTAKIALCAIIWGT